MRNLNSLRVAGLLAALSTTNLALHAQTDAQTVETLREQIRQLDQQLRILERKLEIKDEAAEFRRHARGKIRLPADA